MKVLGPVNGLFSEVIINLNSGFEPKYLLDDYSHKIDFKVFGSIFRAPSIDGIHLRIA